MKTFDFGIMLILFSPIFFVCFFIHDWGFHEQEGNIQYFCQLFPLFLYATCVVLCNLVFLFQQQKRVLRKVGILFCALFIIMPHSVHAYMFADEYFTASHEMKVNPEYGFSHNIILLHHLFVYKICYTASLIQKKKLKCVVLNYSNRDSVVMDFVIKNAHPEFEYMCLRNNQVETQEVFSKVSTSDVVFIIENTRFPSRITTALRESMERAFGTVAKFMIVNWDRRVEVIGISRAGITFIRENKPALQLY